MPSEPVTRYDANYSDGRTAASRPVSVRFEKACLTITAEEDGEIDRWWWPDVRLTEPPAPSRPVRLMNRMTAGARLTIDDPDALRALRAHARYLHRDPVDSRRLLQIGGIVAVCIAIPLFFVYGLPWVARPLVSLVPIAWEAPVGESTIALINRLFADGRPLCEGKAGVAALNKVTRKLTATLDTPYDIRVDVADSDMINALAVPGGRVIVFRGLIDKATAPDEMAGVLAHEMAHVQNRHPTLGMVNTVGWSALLSVFTGGASLSSEAIARLAGHLATSAYTRDLETEADNGAVATLKASGIGSDGLTRFFASVRKMEDKGGHLPEYLSTHPDTAARIAEIERMGSHATAPALSTADWQALRSICRKSGS
jgi:Zn-dependent protease with chaperone function